MLDAWVDRCTSEIGIATMAYNSKRITNVLGAAIADLTKALHA